jgi:hypothetical protein
MFFQQAAEREAEERRFWRRIILVGAAINIALVATVIWLAWPVA